MHAHTRYQQTPPSHNSKISSKFHLKKFKINLKSTPRMGQEKKGASVTGKENFQETGNI